MLRLAKAGITPPRREVYFDRLDRGSKASAALLRTFQRDTEALPNVLDFRVQRSTMRTTPSTRGMQAAVRFLRSMSDLFIRPASSEDAAALVELIGALGYSATAIEMRRRVAALVHRADYVTLGPHYS
jgi:hypothetical protein